MLFKHGHIVATPGALILAENGVNLLKYLERHLSGDWGDLDDEDKAENDFSVKNGFRILSAYNTPSGRLPSCSASRASSIARFMNCLFSIMDLQNKLNKLPNGLFSCRGIGDTSADLLRMNFSKSRRVPEGALAPVSYNWGWAAFDFYYDMVM